MAFDAEERARENLISQYSESWTFKDYVNAMVSPFNDMEYDQEEARLSRNIDFAKGYALDVIGDLVGANRRVVGAAGGIYFGYYENSLSLGTGDQNNPRVGGILYDENLPLSKDYFLSDKGMRDWVKARILVNSCARDIETTASFIRLLFGEFPQLPFTIIEGNCSYKVKINGVLEPNLRGIFARRISVIKPAGVSILLEDSSGNIQLEAEYVKKN